MSTCTHPSTRVVCKHVFEGQSADVLRSEKGEVAAACFKCAQIFWNTSPFNEQAATELARMVCIECGQELGVPASLPEGYYTYDPNVIGVFGHWELAQALWPV